MLRRQRPAVLERDPALAGYVTDRLVEGWAPEQIAGRLKRGVERGLRYVSTETVAVMMAVLGRLTSSMRGSITFDNDTTFARHSLLRGLLSATTYVCDAYTSGQKGGIKNANGSIR